MKTKITLAWACLAVMFIFACKDSVVPEPDNVPKTKKVLDRIIMSRKLFPNEPGFGNTTNGYQTNFINYTYDDKKRLISIKNGDVQTIYWYNDLDQVVRVTSAITAGITPTDMNISYEGGKVKTILSKIPSTGGIREVIYGYVYSGDKVIEVAQNEDGKRTATYTYLYPSPSSVRRVSSDVTYSAISEVTFDSKKTPQANGGAELIFAFPLGPFGSNNPLIRTDTFTTINSISSITNVYTYDEDGFPKTLISTGKSNQTNSVSETRYTYEYKQL